MPKLCLVIALLTCAQAFSQQIKISGSVVDTSENKPLQNAVVSVIRPADSMLVKFTRTKEDGSFSISNLKSANNMKTDLTKLKRTLHSSLKDWGKYGERNTWWGLL